jgi:hypothetical protein
MSFDARRAGKLLVIDQNHFGRVWLGVEDWLLSTLRVQRSTEIDSQMLGLGMTPVNERMSARTSCDSKRPSVSIGGIEQTTSLMIRFNIHPSRLFQVSKATKKRKGR